ETSGKLEELVTKAGGVNEWGVTHNSVFGAAKDQVCHYSKKMRRPNLVIDGHIVRPSAAVKLVGIWIDAKLTFKEQGAAALAKGHEWVVKFRRLAKVSGGMSATNMRRLWIAIGIPRILYGAEIFLAPIHQRERGKNRKRDGRAIVKKLTSIQLRAARLIVGGMVLSPGDLLDAHADLLPMHLAIDRQLQKAPTHPLHAAVSNVERYGHVKKHPSPLHLLMNSYVDVQQNKVEEIPAVRKKAGWRARVEVRVAASKDEAKELALAETARVKLFSDGSLIDGMVGAAGVLMVDGVVKRVKGARLGTARRFGVYEAEGVGEILALECL
ncbi:hypothetical protein C8R46DRAFT_824225, partial [Mycena filopes]